MRTKWGRVSTALAAVAVVLVLVAWPSSLGGATSYVTTHGNSMEPGIHQGDLVLVRRAGGYAVGDVVAYRSATLRTTVLHRIVDEDASGFIAQGDNNDFLDPDRLRDEHILGRQWLHIPGGGRLLGALRVVLLLAVAGITLLGAGKVKRRRRGRPAHLAPAPPRPASSLRSWRTVTIAGGAAAALLLAVGAVAFDRPTSDTVQTSLDYRQLGTFTYEAPAPVGPVYADGRVDTGDPVFLRMIDRLDVTFEYDFESSVARELSGTIGVTAVLSNLSGWRHEITLQEPLPFEDDDSRAQVSIDVGRIESVIAEFAAATGLKPTVNNVAIVPEVQIAGTVDGRDLTERFAPELTFQLDALQLRMTASGDAATAALSPAAAGSLTGTAEIPRRVAALGRSLPVTTARTVAVGLGAPALIVAATGLLVLRRRLQGEAARIELRHGHRMVPVSGRSDRANVIEVRSIQDLARMAESYQSLILHRESDDRHDYELSFDGVVYRYQARGERPTPSRLLG